jgi:hypothetical protein
MNVKENFGAVNEMGKKGFERLSSLGDLNLQVWDKLAARHMESLSRMLEQSGRQLKFVSDAKGYDELIKGQVELAKEAGDHLMSESKANLELAGEVRDDYRAWLQSGVSELTAEMRKAGMSA